MSVVKRSILDRPRKGLVLTLIFLPLFQTFDAWAVFPPHFIAMVRVTLDESINRTQNQGTPASDLAKTKVDLFQFILTMITQQTGPIYLNYFPPSHADIALYEDVFKYAQRFLIRESKGPGINKIIRQELSQNITTFSATQRTFVNILQNKVGTEHLPPRLPPELVISRDWLIRFCQRELASTSSAGNNTVYGMAPTMVPYPTPPLAFNPYLNSMNWSPNLSYSPTTTAFPTNPYYAPALDPQYLTQPGGMPAANYYAVHPGYSQFNSFQNNTQTGFFPTENYGQYEQLAINLPPMAAAPNTSVAPNLPMPRSPETSESKGEEQKYPEVERPIHFNEVLYATVTQYQKAPHVEEHRRALQSLLDRHNEFENFNPDLVAFSYNVLAGAGIYSELTAEYSVPAAAAQLPSEQTDAKDATNATDATNSAGAAEVSVSVTTRRPMPELPLEQEDSPDSAVATQVLVPLTVGIPAPALPPEQKDTAETADATSMSVPAAAGDTPLEIESSVAQFMQAAIENPALQTASQLLNSTQSTSAPLTSGTLPDPAIRSIGGVVSHSAPNEISRTAAPFLPSTPAPKSPNDAPHSNSSVRKSRYQKQRGRNRRTAPQEPTAVTPNSETHGANTRKLYEPPPAQPVKKSSPPKKVKFIEKPSENAPLVESASLPKNIKILTRPKNQSLVKVSAVQPPNSTQKGSTPSRTTPERVQAPVVLMPNSSQEISPPPRTIPETVKAPASLPPKASGQFSPPPRVTPGNVNVPVSPSPKTTKKNSKNFGTAAPAKKASIAPAPQLPVEAISPTSPIPKPVAKIQHWLFPGEFEPSVLDRILGFLAKMDQATDYNEKSDIFYDSKSEMNGLNLDARQSLTLTRLLQMKLIETTEDSAREGQMKIAHTLFQDSADGLVPHLKSILSIRANLLVAHWKKRGEKLRYARFQLDQLKLLPSIQSDEQAQWIIRLENDYQILNDFYLKNIESSLAAVAPTGKTTKATKKLAPVTESLNKKVGTSEHRSRTTPPPQQSVDQTSSIAAALTPATVFLSAADPAAAREPISTTTSKLPEAWLTS